MEIKDFEKLIKILMKKHGLKNWNFKVMKSKRRLGYCQYFNSLSGGCISISIYLIKYGSEERIKNTILHEIAHAMEYQKYGHSTHGHRWKGIAQFVGAEPKATCDDKEYLEKVPAAYMLRCPECGLSVPRYRRKKKSVNYLCPKCHKNGKKSRLLFEEVEK